MTWPGPARTGARAGTDGAGDPTAADGGPLRRLRRSISAKVTTYAALAVLLVGGALALHQPQLLGLGTPFAVALLAGLLLTRQPTVSLTADIDEERVVEGDEVRLTVRLRADVAVDRLELLAGLPAHLSFADGVVMPTAISLAAGETRELGWPVRCERWGVHHLGAVVVRTRGPLGLTTYEAAFPATRTVRVFPAEEELRHLARPARTTLVAGTLVARAKADGFEFADIRPFVPGDRVRNVNWRATARRGELAVNDRHPERSTDVVLLVDAFDNLGLPAAVRAAVSLAGAYLGQRDRVGVISFGGTLRWLRLGLGDRQLYRIVDALIESSALYSYAWKALDLVPPQALPAGALLVAVSPLTDRRTVTALLDRAARGTRVAIVHVSLEPVSEPGDSPTERLGWQLWRHEVARTAERIRERGVPVVSWREGEPLDATIEEVAAFQRYARHRAG